MELSLRYVNLLLFCVHPYARMTICIYIFICLCRFGFHAKKFWFHPVKIHISQFALLERLYPTFERQRHRLSSLNFSSNQAPIFHLSNPLGHQRSSIFFKTHLLSSPHTIPTHRKSLATTYFKSHNSFDPIILPKV